MNSEAETNGSVTKHNPPLITVGQIAVSIGRKRQSVYRAIVRLGIPHAECFNGVKLYPSHVSDTVRENMRRPNFRQREDSRNLAAAASPLPTNGH